MDYTTHADTIRHWLSTHPSTTLPQFLKRTPTTRQWVIDTAATWPTKNIMESVYIALRGEPPHCLCGNKRTFNTFELGYRSGCHLGNRCESVAQDRMTKQRATLEKKYGAASVSSIPGMTEKKRNNYVEKHGVGHHMQLSQYREAVKNQHVRRTKEERADITEKSKSTNLERWGTAHHMQCESQREKVATTNISRYGCTSPLQNEEINNRFRETLRSRTVEQIAQTVEAGRKTLQDRWGVTAPSRIGISQTTLDILDDQHAFTAYVSGKTRQQVQTQLGIAPHTLYLYAKQWGASDLFAHPTTSQLETEVAQFLNEHGITYTQHDRKIIHPLELDFYIPQLRVALEVGGIYWHSECSAGRGRNYHYTKWNECNRRGIKLITMFDDEWYQHRTIVERRLLHALGRSQSPAVGARNCTIHTEDSPVTKEFIDTHHLSGWAPSTINLSLRDRGGNNVVAMMTFGHSRFNKKYQYEMIRYCTSTTVSGGASKLFKHFLSTYGQPSVISFSDNRWGLGQVYKHLGFVNDGHTLGYQYTDYVNRYSRQQFQKHKLVAEGHDPRLSEWQIMQSRGFDRIWDCGQTRWIYAK